MEFAALLAAPCTACPASTATPAGPANFEAPAAAPLFAAASVPVPAVTGAPDCCGGMLAPGSACCAGGVDGGGAPGLSWPPELSGEGGAEPCGFCWPGSGRF